MDKTFDPASPSRKAAIKLFEQSISELAAVGIKPGMEVIFELLRQLGDPQKDLQVIHVAGTNGKGSVCAMLERCLREAGFRTGLFTSPHMLYYNERFRVNGEMIDDDQLMILLGDVKEAVERTEASIGQRPKEFEILTAMSFLWFYRQKVEILVLETGMGGRYDATNVFSHPLLSIITSISMDHEAYLGNTLALIAGEKAGIIKAGSSLVTSCDEASAMEVIDQEFRTLQAGNSAARIIRVAQDCRWASRSLGMTGQEIDLETPAHTYKALHLPKPGEYQCSNLACVVSAWELLGGENSPLAYGKERLTEAVLREGLASVRWPCRLELVQENPSVVLDGSHNPDGIRQLAVWLAQARESYDQVILVMGMLEDKDRLSAARELDGMASRLIITKPLSARAGQWQDLAKGFQSLSESNTEFIEDCHEAVKRAIALAGDKDLVLCTGSLYLVGELRRNWPELPL